MATSDHFNVFLWWQWFSDARAQHEECGNVPGTSHAQTTFGAVADSKGDACCLGVGRSRRLRGLMAMKPAPFKYMAARSAAEALDLKAMHGDEAAFLAGGQSLIPAMNFRLARPAVLIDINPLVALDGIRAQRGGAVRIGALTRHRTLERDPIIARHQPLLHEVLPHIAHLQIRNRGTLGGNLAHADPASELPAVMLVLDAKLRAQSISSERWIEANAFFKAALTCALRADEMLVEVEVPELPPRCGTCFVEVARRRGDFALMGVAAVIALSEAGICTEARLAYCGAGDTPVRVEAARSLVGGTITEAAIRAAATLAAHELDPPGNVHAGRDYQRHLAGVLTRRALLTALERCRSAI
jgi:aerobic carbon-monoxide dehydrogenase medium subunit